MANTTIIGAKELIEKLDKFAGQIDDYVGHAGKEAIEDVILPTEGLKTYPPTSEANYPPVPFYVRGEGMQYASGNVGGSEKAGTQFYSRIDGPRAYVGNRATYAQYLFAKDTQARAMAAIGWATLEDVIDEQMEEIIAVYDAWVSKALADMGLK